MDGYKVGSARIYQLFSNATGGSSSNSDSSNKGSEVQRTRATDVQQQSQAQAQNTPPPPPQNTDAVKVSPAAQQEQAARASRVQELKQQVQSGDYQKQLKSSATVQQVAKSIVEFYSA